MKRLCFYLLMQFIILGLYSQEVSIETLQSIGLPYNENTRKVTFIDVVQVPNIDKDKLYSIVKSEITMLLKNNKMVTLIDDAEFGRLVLESTYELVLKRGANHTFYNMIYTLIIDFKDNRFKYTLTDYNLFNAELPIFKSTSVSWVDGISTTKLKENKVKLYPFEIFFSDEDNRKENKEIFPSFNQVNEELISKIKKIPAVSDPNW